MSKTEKEIMQLVADYLNKEHGFSVHDSSTVIEYEKNKPLLLLKGCLDYNELLAISRIINEEGYSI